MPSATDAELVEAIYKSLDRLAAWYRSVAATVSGLGGTLLWDRADALQDTDYENNLTVRNTNNLDEALTVMPYLSRFLGKWLKSHDKWIVDAGITDADGVNLFGLNDYIIDREFRVHDNVNKLFLLNSRSRPFKPAAVFADAGTVIADITFETGGTLTVNTPYADLVLPDHIGDCKMEWKVVSGTVNNGDIEVFTRFLSVSGADIQPTEDNTPAVIQIPSTSTVDDTGFIYPGTLGGAVYPNTEGATAIVGATSLDVSGIPNEWGIARSSMLISGTVGGILQNQVVAMLNDAFDSDPIPILPGIRYAFPSSSVVSAMAHGVLSITWSNPVNAPTGSAVRVRFQTVEDRVPAF